MTIVYLKIFVNFWYDIEKSGNETESHAFKDTLSNVVSDTFQVLGWQSCWNSAKIDPCETIDLTRGADKYQEI